jgi:hypothetical protein
MYKNIFLIFSVALICLSSCKKDPWDDISDGSWNHERTILDIKLEGQAGLAEIENTDATTGVITLKISPDLVADMSKVQIQTLSLSYKATSSVAKGETVDFSGSSSPTITITSQTNESRTYTLNMTLFKEPLVGTYAINDLYVYGGTGPMYGGAYSARIRDKSWLWTTGSTGPSAECDNYLVFTMSKITDEGNTTGDCYNYGGADSNWWDCILVASQNKAGTGDLNLEKFYRAIPKGHSTWLHNYTAGTITFTSDNGVTTTSTLLDAGTYTMYSNGSVTKTMIVPNQAFQFTVAGVDDWSTIYSDYNIFVASPHKYFVLVTKMADSYSLPDNLKTLP